MLSSEIRQKYIEFFQARGHTYVPSSSTIPLNDPTILFTIAGMTQFKAALTGQETRPYQRAVNAQKCIRVADLEDVGKDGRHNTMFEMLGNWSFGDYYKKDAIYWAYTFVRDVLKLDLNRLWATVHHSDDEAYGLWQEVGMPTERIVRLGDKDNFWTMGPTGPCGPCTELYLDQGPQVGHCNVAGAPCQKGPGCDCDRYLEFWNLVFMQYNRLEDGTLEELPFKSVDTGAGLERLAALMQGKTSNFDSDIFASLKEKTLSLAGHPPLGAPQKESLNVVVDHIRTLCFTIADGANFSAEGRGYVLRRVLRRAVRHAYRLAPHWDKHTSFMAQLVPTVVDQWRTAYPELGEHEHRIQDTISREELRFSATLQGGLERFQEFANQTKEQGRNTLSGQDAFLLHDSFGFPIDLTALLCGEQGLKVDEMGYKEAMDAQRAKSRAEAKFYKSEGDATPWTTLFPALQEEDGFFNGYTLPAQGPVALEPGRCKRLRVTQNHLVEVVLAKTPFYPEGGGQVADQGRIVAGGQAFEVVDVRKIPGAIVHVLKPEGCGHSAPPLEELVSLFKGPLEATVDREARLQSSCHHTATHLLHKALQVVLGPQARQAGSHVSPEGLRFDVTHPDPISPEQLTQIEHLVNATIQRALPLEVQNSVPIDQARAQGAMAMFGEKYEDVVRIVGVPGFSLELCGGLHVSNTGQIGLFLITHESGVTAGVRRIEALAGQVAFSHVEKLRSTVLEGAHSLKCPPHDLLQKIHHLLGDMKTMDHTLAQLRNRLVQAQVEGALQKSILKNGHSFLALLAPSDSLDESQLLVDRLIQKGVSVVALVGAASGKPFLLCATEAATSQKSPMLQSGHIVKTHCSQWGGKGGGKPTFARGGFPESQPLPKAVEDLRRYFETLEV